MKKLIEAIEKYSDKYQFSFQFWGNGENNVYIAKDDINLYDTGGYLTIEDVMIAALHYIYKVNRVPESERVC